MEVRGFNDNDNNPLTGATVYFGDWCLMAPEASRVEFTKVASPAPKATQPATKSACEIDYIKTAQSYGFATIPWPEFIAKTNLPHGLTDQASEIQTTVDGSHVLYVPPANSGGFMLIGNDPIALDKEWEEHFLIQDIAYTYSAQSFGQPKCE